MLRRSGFKAKGYTPKPAKQWEGPAPVQAPPRATLQPSTGHRAVAKDAPVRSEAYRRLVAALPCIHCGVQGFTQVAHGDEGKGMGIKSSDLTCYPACGPRPGEAGCHWLIGTSGEIPRAERRALEAAYGEQTRLQLGM